jgi:hypothetical protein
MRLCNLQRQPNLGIWLALPGCPATFVPENSSRTASSVSGVAVQSIPTDDLYHYTSAAVGLDSIVADLRLRLGLLESTNDPRESRPSYPSLTIAEGVTDEGLHELWDAADHLVRRATKVACFTRDYSLPEDFVRRDDLRGYAHPAMWAHYGGSHTGVCLTFSKSRLDTRMTEQLADRGDLFSGAVEYSYDPFNALAADAFDVEQVDEFGLDAVVARYIATNHRSLFFRKHPDWSSELEYRWVLRDGGALPVHVNISGCLTGIVLGDAFPSNRLTAVLELAGGHELQLSQVRFHNRQVLRVPVAPLPAPDTRRHTRPGPVAERLAALKQAEADAVRAESHARTAASQATGRVDRIVEEVAEILRARSDVAVQVHRSVHAISPRDRRRSPGVPTRRSVLDYGVMAVAEHQPQYSFTFVAALAVQVLDTGGMRVHAVLDLERWLPDGNEREVMWRDTREIGDAIDRWATAVDVVAQDLRQRLDSALAEFDEQRGVDSS